MKVYVPSMGRAGQIGDRVMTQTYIKNATYVVPPDEVDRYQRQLNFYGRDGSTYEVLSCPEKGIAATRHWIGRHCDAVGEDKFCMMDDDMRFARRKNAVGVELTDCRPDDIRRMLAWIEEKLDHYAHASVTARDKNHSVPYMCAGTAYSLWQENKRTLRVLAYRTEDFLSVEHGRVDVMEDFDVNLQLLETGRKNVLSYYWTSDQKETGTKGGCSSYRSKAVHEDSARKIVELHPTVTKLRQKESKNKGLSEEARRLASRLEVTVDWEGAHALSGGTTRRSPQYDIWVKQGRPEWARA